MDLSSVYSIPEWSSIPPQPIQLQVIRDGVLLQEMVLPRKPVHLIGSTPLCDIRLDHPSISRSHGVLQSSKDGTFILDLNSRNGTFLNNVRLPPSVHSRLHPFDQVRFGYSFKTYVLKEPQQMQQERCFLDVLKQASKSLSPKQYKNMYLTMVDQKYGSKQEKRQIHVQDVQPEVNWGMVDQQEIYQCQKNDDYPIDCELMSRLPGLPPQMLKMVDNLEKQLQKSSQTRQSLRRNKNKNKNDKLQADLLQYQNKISQLQQQIKRNLFDQDAAQQSDSQQQVQNAPQENGPQLVGKRAVVLREIEKLQGWDQEQADGDDALDAFMHENDKEVAITKKQQLKEQLLRIDIKLGNMHQKPKQEFIFQPFIQPQISKPNLTSLQNAMNQIANKSRQQALHPLKQISKKAGVQKRAFDPCPRVQDLCQQEPQKRKMMFGVAQKRPGRDQQQTNQEGDVQDLTQF